MSIARLLAALLVAAVPLAAPVHAAKRIKPGPVSLDPKLGYVLVRLGPTQGKKGKAAEVHLWRYDVARGDIRFAKKKDPNPVPKGEDASVAIGDRPFAPGLDNSSFLVSLTPGDWVIHGTATTCFCLGSYRFAVRPGEITDIGTVLTARDDGSATDATLNRHPVSADITSERGYLVNDQMLVRAATEADRVPAELAGKPLTRAALVPDARFLNRGVTRFGYAGGLLLARAANLEDPVPGDGARAVALVKAGDELRTRPPVEKADAAKGTPAKPAG
ncbi:MAG TPA: hypothetical protein VF592_13340 [Sphingomonas sp.]|jgi:hypothetical protein|uniref:hypothetical protein n=1 Tax=Sphingomonas sp. TaxID=28214 RepID=UPI002EDAC53C